MIEALLKFANGYRLVGIKEFVGREGSAYTATILKDGKIIGEATDYGNGGNMDISIANDEARTALLAYSKGLYPQYEFEHDGSFIDDLVNYELAVKKIRSIAAKKLMMADEKELDENGIATGYMSWNAPDTPANRASLLKQKPETVFLNDEILKFPAIRKPSK